MSEEMLLMHRLKIWLIALAIVSPIFTSSTPIQAQEPLTQTITTEGGTLTLSYPENWQAEEGQGQIVLTNSTIPPLAIDARNLTTGIIRASVLILPPEMIGLDPKASFEDVVITIEQFISEDQSENPSVLVTSKVTEINGQKAHYFIYTQSNFEQYTLLIEVGENGVLDIEGVSLVGEMSNFIPTLDAIAASTIYTPPISNVSGKTIWQQVGIAYEEPDSIGSLGGLAVGPDDTIYVADYSNGIAVFSSEGKFQKFITGAWDEAYPSDVVIATDGTLWFVGGNQQVYQIDLEGNVLQTWGQAGNASGQFGDDSPQQIEITSEGHIVTLDTNSDSSGNDFGRVQIWDGNGNLLSEFTPTDESVRNFSNGVIAVAPDGSVYIAQFTQVNQYEQDGTLLRESIGITNLNTSLSVGEISTLFVTPDGSLLIATDFSDGTIYYFDPAGNYLQEFGDSPFNADPNNETKEFFDPGTFYAPNGIGILSNGDFVVADTGRDYWQLVRFSFEE